MDFEAYFQQAQRDYTVLRVLSAKPETASYLLRHKTLGKKLVLRRAAGQQPVYQLLCGTAHANLPLVYDTVTLADGFAVLEEYIEGVTVAEVLENGPYTYGGAKKVLQGVCAALLFLHGNGVVHRDVKPENIVVDSYRNVKLIDFDIARVYTGAGRDTCPLGTLGYAPPEQQGLSETDPRSDIYALGVLLNVMLTRAHPSVRLAPGKAGKIVLKCTAVSPEKRFQTVEELLERL